MNKARKLAFGVALTTATVLAGIGLANAQTDAPTTLPPPTEEAPDAPSPGERGENCPDKEGRGGSEGTSADSISLRLARL